MYRYDNYTDSFVRIDGEPNTGSTTVRVGVPLKETAIIVKKVELTDECIDKIAEVVVRKLADRKTEPTHDIHTETHECVKSNAEQHVQRIEYVESVERSRCRKCKHFGVEYETPISSDGRYYTYITCTASNCIYEPKGEPQMETTNLNENSNENLNIILVNDGVTEAVRCAMCNNPNKSDRGCDGACSYDDVLYKKIIDAIHECKYEPKDEPKTERSE